jgi:hypothetical protein
MTGRFDIEAPLYDTVCDGTALSDFRLLAESGRYQSSSGPRGGPSPLARLAAFVAGRGGERRDRPIYELCHFVVALADHGMGSEGERIRLLFGLDPVTPGTIRKAIGARTDDVEDDGLAHGEGEKRFLTSYRRAPFLFAVHEFLAQMDACVYYGELNDVFEKMLSEGGDEAAIRVASNAIARRLAQYRRAHFDWSASAETFAVLSRFLSGREGEARWRIDDETIFEFWRENSVRGRFREYRTSFDAFTRLMRALDGAARIRDAERVLPLGAARDAGEFDLAEAADAEWGQMEWENPLACFEDERLQRINFFKMASEHRPMEALMHYGPYALRLIHAFLRLESFAPIQSAISNDLRVGRGSASVSRRLELGAATTYREKQRQLKELLDHVSALMQATLYVVGSEDLPTEVSDAAERKYRAIRRRGFEKNGHRDAEQTAAFTTAAEKLPLIADQLRNFLNRLDHLGDQVFLEQLFETDKREFRHQFRLLYGKSA